MPQPMTPMVILPDGGVLPLPAQHGAGQNGGQDHGGAGGFEKLAAVKTFGGQGFLHGGS